ncbi:hypothetical protein E2C01_080468 [Portunus trituberculatus]|uniref:Uncharacterized protein n=1 Tax=Portunus trituberculatus TaxID=210409 RepID=A0A5B7IZP6_PORTR|nr:hypothetical protein [Portunus trituberculatus]
MTKKVLKCTAVNVRHRPLTAPHAKLARMWHVSSTMPGTLLLPTTVPTPRPPRRPRFPPVLVFLLRFTRLYSVNL